MDHPVAQFFPPNPRAANDMHHLLVRWHDRLQYRLQMLSFNTRGAAESTATLLHRLLGEGTKTVIVEDTQKDAAALVASLSAPMSE